MSRNEALECVFAEATFEDAKALAELHVASFHRRDHPVVSHEQQKRMLSEVQILIGTKIKDLRRDWRIFCAFSRENKSLLGYIEFRIIGSNFKERPHPVIRSPPEEAFTLEDTSMFNETSTFEEASTREEKSSHAVQRKDDIEQIPAREGNDVGASATAGFDSNPADRRRIRHKSGFGGTVDKVSILEAFTWAPMPSQISINHRITNSVTLDGAMMRHMGPNTFWKLHSFAVVHHARSHGIGTKLLEWCEEQLWSRNLECYVQTPEIYLQYFLKRGFLEIEVLQIIGEQFLGMAVVKNIYCLYSSESIHQMNKDRLRLRERLDGMDLFLKAPKMEYEDLEGTDSFRVLEILPGERDDPIRCIVKTASLSSPPAFQALSYAWGSSEERIPILCNNARFGITFNLFTALRRMRDSNVVQTFWADAICINQANKVEKKQQVRIMKNIYAKASSVTIWLGDLDPRIEAGAGIGLLTLQELLESDRAGIGGQASEKKYGVYAILMNDMDLTVVMRFLQRPWFQRVWVMEEVSVGKSPRICWGSEDIFEMPWDDLWKMSYSLVTSAFLSDYGTHLKPHSIRDWARIYQIGMTRHQYQLEEEHDKPGLLNMLLSTRRCRTMNARDKVIGVLGLCRDLRPEDWAIADYEKPDAMVFLETTEMLLLKHGLRVLTQAHAWPPSHRKLPTWVIEWDIEPSVAHYLCMSSPIPGQIDQYRICAYRAGGPNVRPLTDVPPHYRKFTRPPEASFIVSEREIHCQVLFVDTIRIMGRTRTPFLDDIGQVWSHVATIIEELAELLFDNGFCSHNYGTGICPDQTAGQPCSDPQLSIDTTLALMLMQILQPGRNKGESYEQYAFGYRLLVDHMILRKPKIIDVRRVKSENQVGWVHDDEFAETRRRDEAVTEFCLWVMERFVGRRFCITKGFRAGWVPNNTKPGDFIVVIPGTNVPFVVRCIETDFDRDEIPESDQRDEVPQPNHAGEESIQEPDNSERPWPRFQLVGECFLYGIMFGQALEKEDLKFTGITIV